jgi:hypothetical protein
VATAQWSGKTGVKIVAKYVAKQVAKNDIILARMGEHAVHHKDKSEAIQPPLQA